MKKKVIIDCDPGHDDAVAIMMAASHPTIELIGITTVKGNHTLSRTTQNALNVCQYLNIDVPVCQGMDRPIVRNSPPVEDRIHGETGLDGPVFEKTTRQKDSRHAVDFIIDTLLSSDEEITLVPTGPLSNIGLAIRKEPKILDKIKEIVLMGGTYQLGNVTPAAEFNIFADPEAAHIVFTCGRPVTMMGLDVTRKALCYPEIIARMAKINNQASKLFVDLMKYFSKTQKMVFGWEGGPLHDPTCIAYLIDPSCIELKSMYTEIDISGDSSYGRTNCDFFNISGKEHNSKVAIEIDANKFWNIIEECIKYYDN
jgi:ribosylpyrimidine nucleosidase